MYSTHIFLTTRLNFFPFVTGMLLPDKFQKA